MSTEKNGFVEKINAFGCFLQRSKAVSFLMILMVFATGVLLLWKMPNESDLPQLNEGDPVQEDIVAKIDFKCKDKKDEGRLRGEIERSFPLYLRIETNRTKKILDGYRTMMDEIQRRDAADKEEKAYEPLNTTDVWIASFVKELQPYLYSILLELSRDKERGATAAGYVSAIVEQGIAEPRQEEVRPEDSAKTVMIQDAELRESVSRLSDIQTPESAAGKTVNALLSLFSEEQRIQLDPGKLKDFFGILYREGNLRVDKELTDKRRDEKIEKEIAALKDILHRKGEILISGNGEPLSKPDFELLKEYRRQYEIHRLDQRTWKTLSHKTLLVALLVVFTCIFILRVHPELFGNNRSIWLIGFIVIFSLLFNCGIMKLFNQWILDGRLAAKIPLYLAMPFALPALVIASIYGGRSAVFAGLFVAGVSAVALDLSFPAFATGLFVCAMSTFFVRRVFDYPKFFIRAFVSCTVTMLFSAIIFQENPDILAFLWRTVKSVFLWKKPVMDIDVNQLGSCLVMPAVNGIVTAGVAVVLIMLLVTLLDVTCNMSYLSMIDRNHPLLRKLQLEAPGTYHHSERVALLAEEAADCVGAMSLKVQAYALFHDVGKLASPEKFTENASGKDMSKGQLPAECAAIIRNHVEYGVQLAKKYKLKTPLRRAIECHHGNDFISFFYEKEKERTGVTPPEEPFRYPGPLPEELEAVILMMADCCEAAVCSLDEPTEDNVRALVEKIFNGKLQRRQLDAANVTMAQLWKIRESFLKTFKSMNHTRISYSSHQEKQS